MTIETLIAVFTVLLTIALAVERLIQVAKPLLEKIQDPDWLESAKVVSAIVVGFGLAALFRFDLLARLTVTGTLPVVGYALAGLVASVGSSTLHALLEWLKTLQEPKNTITTTTKTTTSAPVPAGVTVTTTTTPPAG
jgi:hypothetical protein